MGADPIAGIAVAEDSHVNRHSDHSDNTEESSNWTLGSLTSRLRFTPPSQRPIQQSAVVTPECSAPNGLLAPPSTNLSDTSHTSNLAGILGSNIGLEEVEAALQLIVQQKKTHGDNPHAQIAPKAQAPHINAQSVARTLIFGSPANPVAVQPVNTPTTSTATRIPSGTTVVCKVHGATNLGTIASTPAGHFMSHWTIAPVISSKSHQPSCMCGPRTCPLPPWHHLQASRPPSRPRHRITGARRIVNPNEGNWSLPTHRTIEMHACPSMTAHSSPLLATSGKLPMVTTIHSSTRPQPRP